MLEQLEPRKRKGSVAGVGAPPYPLTAVLIKDVLVSHFVDHFISLYVCKVVVTAFSNGCMASDDIVAERNAAR